MPNPLPKLAAAYKLHGHMKFQGLDISIENRKGSVRRWFDPHGKETGSTKMHCAYGYIKKTKGTDGDHVDVYVGPKADADQAFIVNQMKKPPGDIKKDGKAWTKFDEQKVMLGFTSEKEAKAAYFKQYDDPRFFGSMKAMGMDEFKEKVLMKSNHGNKVAALFNSDLWDTKEKRTKRRAARGKPAFISTPEGKHWLNTGDDWEARSLRDIMGIPHPQKKVAMKRKNKQRLFRAGLGGAFVGGVGLAQGAPLLHAGAGALLGAGAGLAGGELGDYMVRKGKLAAERKPVRGRADIVDFYLNRAKEKRADEFLGLWEDSPGNAPHVPPSERKKKKVASDTMWTSVVAEKFAEKALTSEEEAMAEKIDTAALGTLALPVAAEGVAKMLHGRKGMAGAIGRGAENFAEKAFVPMELGGLAALVPKWQRGMARGAVAAKHAVTGAPEPKAKVAMPGLGPMPGHTSGGGKAQPPIMPAQNMIPMGKKPPAAQPPSARVPSAPGMESMPKIAALPQPKWDIPIKAPTLVKATSKPFSAMAKKKVASAPAVAEAAYACGIEELPLLIALDAGATLAKTSGLGKALAVGAGLTAVGGGLLAGKKAIDKTTKLVKPHHVSGVPARQAPGMPSIGR